MTEGNESENHEEHMVSKIAEALYNQAFIEVKNKAAKIQIPVEQIDRVLKEVISTSDRSAAILLFALIDDIFISFYKQYLNPQIKGGHAALFDGFGILSTANSRITLAASIYWIDRPTYNNLNLLRRIRNHFAHETKVHSFSDEPIKGLIHTLPKYEEAIIRKIDREIPPLDDRKMFLVRAFNVVSHLVADMAVMKHSREHRVSPRSFAWEVLPDNLKEVYHVTGGAMMSVLGVQE